MTFPLPRKPDIANVADVKALALKAFVAFSDLIEYLRALPLVEVKVWSGTVKDLPVPLRLTRIGRPLGIMIGKAFETAKPQEAISVPSLHWYPSENADEPGAVVSDLDSLPDDVHYTVHFVVIGER